MKKKLLITLIVVTITLSATAVKAYTKMDVVAETNDGTWVQSFSDGDNKCYVVERHGNEWPGTYAENNALAISCVRAK